MTLSLSLLPVLANVHSLEGSARVGARDTHDALEDAALPNSQLEPHQFPVSE